MKLNTLLRWTGAWLAFSAGSAMGQNTSGVDVPAAPTFSVEEPKVYGRQIAEHADLYDRGWRDEVVQGTMTLFDGDGDSVRRAYTRMALENFTDGDKFIVKFVSPAEIKGVAALTHENSGSSDDNWLYLPSTKRVRRISGANNTASFQGTEFTYEDLSNLDHAEYEWRFQEETELQRDGAPLKVLKLDAKPTYSDTGYSRITVYYSQEHWRQERIEYYDKAGQLLKTRDTRGWKLVHGRFWRAGEVEMINHQTGKKTTLDQSRRFLNLSLYKSSRTGKPRPNLGDDQFTTRAIQS